MKTLKELKCHMVFQKNNTMNCINGYLAKTDGKKGYIKAFLYDTEEECLNAATKWANANPRSLKNSGWGESFQPDAVDMSISRLSI